MVIFPIKFCNIQWLWYPSLWLHVYHISRSICWNTGIPITMSVLIESAYGASWWAGAFSHQAIASLLSWYNIVILCYRLRLNGMVAVWRRWLCFNFVLTLFFVLVASGLTPAWVRARAFCNSYKQICMNDYFWFDNPFYTLSHENIITSLTATTRPVLLMTPSVVTWPNLELILTLELYLDTVKFTWVL